MSELIEIKSSQQGKSWGHAVTSMSGLSIASDKTLYSLVRCYPIEIKKIFDRLDQALYNKTDHRTVLIETVELENKRLKVMLDQQTKVICKLRSEKLETKAKLGDN